MNGEGFRRKRKIPEFAEGALGKPRKITVSEAVCEPVFESGTSQE
jgi:hypothetical protein